MNLESMLEATRAAVLAATAAVTGVPPVEPDPEPGAVEPVMVPAPIMPEAVKPEVSARESERSTVTVCAAPDDGTAGVCRTVGEGSP